MNQKARLGIAPHIQRLLEASILTLFQLAWNMPFLSVYKPGSSDYWPAQDLREGNKQTEIIHFTGPNTYILLSLLSDQQVYRVLDLENAFSFILPVPGCQPIFAFEWADQVSNETSQVT